MSCARRALLVGLASFEWNFLRPLLDSGRLPSLACLIERGAHGRLRTLQPQFEPLLWTSMASGRRADSHRVLGSRDFRSGLPTPLSSLTRAAHCLWHYLGGTGRQSILVNWPLTYPVEPVSGTCVSDLFFRLAGTPDGLAPLPEGSVSPSSRSAELETLRLSPARLKPDELGFFIDQPDANDPLLSHLAVCLAEQISTHAVSMELLKESDWSLGILRYGLLDALGPRFMAAHPPRLDWVPEQVFKRYRNTMMHAAIYMDHQLGNLLEHIGEQDLVMLVSERGLLSDQRRPVRKEVAASSAGAPWYVEHGIVVMAGPGIIAGGEIVGAGLLDVAPTVLHALGIEQPDGLEGRVLLEAYSKPRPPRPSPMPAPALERCGGHAPGRQLSTAEAELLSLHWRETGIDRRATRDAGDSREEQANQFNLAAVHLDAGWFDRALPILESLYRHQPANERVMIHLARCLQACGETERARQLLEQVVDHPDIRPYELMELARLHQSEGRVDEALASLFRAEQSEGDRPGVHCRIGQVYLQMERFGEAERAFTKALERGPDHAESHLGLARTRLGQGQPQEAVDSALKAVELNHAMVSAHYWLGMALSNAELLKEAVTAFETVLTMRPGDQSTLKGLIEVLDRLGQGEQAREYRARLRKVEVASQLAHSARESLQRI